MAYGFFALVLSLLLAPFVYGLAIISGVLNEILRTFVWVLLLLRHGCKWTLIQNGSDVWMSHKKKFSGRYSHVLFTFPQGEVDLEKIIFTYKTHIQPYRDPQGRRIYSRFENILTTFCGYWCWKKVDDFDFRNHIRLVNDLNVYSPKDLEHLLAQEFTEDMDESKPQWEVAFLPKYYDGEMKCLVLARYSHTYLDGMSCLMMLRNTIAPDTQCQIDPLKFSLPFYKKFLMHTQAFLFLPYIFVAMFLETRFRNFWIKREEIERKKQYAWHHQQHIEVKDLKTIRDWAGSKGLKISVPTIITTAAVASLRKTFPNQKFNKKVTVMEVVTMLPYPDSRPQNRISTIQYDVQPSSFTDSDSLLKSLKECQKAYIHAFIGPLMTSMYFGLKIFGRFPYWLAPIYNTGTLSSLGIINSPFSKNSVIVEPYGVTPLDCWSFSPQINDLGLTLTPTVYDDKMIISGIGDTSWVSREELDAFLQQIIQEIDQLVKIATKTRHNQQNYNTFPTLV